MADSLQDGTRMNSLIHRAVRRDLGDFASALDGFPAGDRERAAALAARFQWFDRLLTHHHEGEEHIVPNIVASVLADIRRSRRYTPRRRPVKVVGGRSVASTIEAQLGR